MSSEADRDNLLAGLLLYVTSVEATLSSFLKLMVAKGVVSAEEAAAIDRDAMDALKARFEEQGLDLAKVMDSVEA